MTRLVIAAGLCATAVAVVYLCRDRPPNGGGGGTPVMKRPVPTAAAVAQRTIPSSTRPTVAWASSPPGTVRVGDVEVRVRDAYLTPALHDAAGARLPGERQRLVITLRLSNVGTRPVRYRSWSNGYGDHDWPAVADDAGIHYRWVADQSDRKSALRWAFTSGHGYSWGAEVRPGEWTQDCLVFDRPVDRAKYVRLSLPADHLPGGDGLIHFQIVDLDTRRISHLSDIPNPGLLQPGEPDRGRDEQDDRPFKLNLLRDPPAAPSPAPH